MKTIAASFFCLLVLFGQFPLMPQGHDSPIDHVDRGIRIWVEGENIWVAYQIQVSERMALMQLHAMDINGDGAVSDEERDVFFERFYAMLKPQIELELNGQKIELKPALKVQFLPQFHQIFTFSGAIGKLTEKKMNGQFMDSYSRNYPGDYRWDGPKVDTGLGPQVKVTEDPKTADLQGRHSMLVIKFEIVSP